LKLSRSFAPADLERELAYYRRECNDLGARLLRLQEEQSQAFREARRSRTVAKLIREAHRLADFCATAEDIGPSLLEVIVENTLCDRAALAHCEDPWDTAPRFRITHAIGFGAEAPPEWAAIPAPPNFFLTTSRSAIESPAYELTNLLRLPYVLWAYDRASGHAVILGNQTESNVSRPFEAGDQELIEGALSVYIDVLARKQAELQLHAAKIMAEEASELRARFIATLSHELRTPLNAIIGFSDLMLPGARRPPTPERSLEYVRQINESGHVLLELLNDILDYSQMANLKPRLQRSWCSAEGLVTQAIQQLAGQALKAEIELTMEPHEAPLELLVDPRRFRQVLSNLISNALKFTGRAGQVKLSLARDPDGAARLVVSDTGIGMRAEDIPRALEPFQQIDGGHARSFPGTGLGLPIVKGLVEAHDGRLEINSAVGSGTTVVVHLPPAVVRIAPSDQATLGAA
jgi:signal transduction histidine kinase